MATGKFVSYLRVSTDAQGRSGLGLEAQRETVARYLNGGNWTLVREFIETESGKKNDRPQLAAALAHARRIGGTLVVAKLDRLSRDLDLVRTVIKSEANVVFCDLPEVPAGATGRFLLTQMAAVAELEAGLISERTKAALAAAKARGVKLGNPNGAAHLKGRGNAEAVKTIKTKAQARALDLSAVVADIKAMGITTVRGIAEELNRQGIRSPRGGKWNPSSVYRLLRRLA